MNARLLDPIQFHGAVDELWDRGLPPGDLTGWPSLDRHYTVAPGQMTIVTGWPSSGKSEWLDALLINLIHQGWYAAIFSPENRPVELHIAKILEKMSGKPFGHGPTERLTKREVSELLVKEVASRIAFVEPPDEEVSLTAQNVIEAALPWLESRKQGAKRALVIDPWNELEHWRPRELSETEYVSRTLSLVRKWARKNAVHVFLVAHPQKMRRGDNGKLPIPTPDMISGSQHWWNKADCNITVHREQGDSPSDEVEIHVQKVRFKNIGRQGLVVLRYDRVSGQYREQPHNMYDVKRR